MVVSKESKKILIIFSAIALVAAGAVDYGLYVVHHVIDLSRDGEQFMSIVSFLCTCAICVSSTLLVVLLSSMSVSQERLCLTCKKMARARFAFCGECLENLLRGDKELT